MKTTVIKLNRYLASCIQGVYREKQLRLTVHRITINHEKLGVALSLIYNVREGITTTLITLMNTYLPRGLTPEPT